MLKLLKKFLSVLLLTATLLPAGYAAPENSTGADKSSEANNKALPHYTVELAPEVTLELVLLKGGTFIMGSPESEIGRWKGQGEDQRKVVITRPFYIAVFETTQAQYEAVMKRNPSVRSRGPHLPVTDVSWQDAMDFCARLNLLTEKTRPANYKFTLPTEAQWEYACRARTTTSLNNGEDVQILGKHNSPNLGLLAWYGGNCGQGYKTRYYYYDISRWKEKQYEDSRYGGSHTVGEKKPNKWGIYDMHGNVGEWCYDYYGPYPSRGQDSVGPKTGEKRVCRGGRWSFVPEKCRSAARNPEDPTKRFIAVGFRLALVPIK